jgi:hypothetical protein
MKAEFVGDKIDAIGGHHVKSGVGDIHDAGYPKDKRKPNSQKGIHTSAYQPADDDVYYHKASVDCFLPSFVRRGGVKRNDYCLYFLMTQGGIL